MASQGGGGGPGFGNEFGDFMSDIFDNFFGDFQSASDPSMKLNKSRQKVKYKVKSKRTRLSEIFSKGDRVRLLNIDVPSLWDRTYLISAHGGIQNDCLGSEKLSITLREKCTVKIPENVYIISVGKSMYVSFSTIYRIYNSFHSLNQNYIRWLFDFTKYNKLSFKLILLLYFSIIDVSKKGVSDGKVAIH